MEEKRHIVSFSDLEVYQNSYKAMLIVMKEIVVKLPDSEKYDLKDQLSRACKSIPRLIAEGYAKRHQKMGFQKYIDDAMGESNEMVVSSLLKKSQLRHSEAEGRRISDGDAILRFAQDDENRVFQQTVSLSQSRDIYPTYIDMKTCEDLIDIYDKIGRQLYKLGNSWTNFKRQQS